MTSAKTAPASRPADGPSDGLHYTHRCLSCHRALTKLDIVNRLASGDPICTCGHGRFRPTTFKWWEELFLLRSWRMYFAIRRGELAPPPTPDMSFDNNRAAVKKMIELGFDSDPEDAEEMEMYRKPVLASLDYEEEGLDRKEEGEE